jgi:hypothetical protein
VIDASKTGSALVETQECVTSIRESDFGARVGAVHNDYKICGVYEDVRRNLLMESAVGSSVAT